MSRGAVYADASGSARSAADRLAAMVLGVISAGVLLVVGLAFSGTIIEGMQNLSLAFFLEHPRSAGRAGGILPVLVSTATVLLLTLAFVVPVGIATALYLSEFSRGDSRASRNLRTALDVLTSFPSIVFGLFGNALFCGLLGLGYSVLSGSLTLAVMIVPFFARAAERILRDVDFELRLNAEALGMSRLGAIGFIILPSALPGLLSVLVLAIGRALAETAAVLFTAGYSLRAPESLFDPGRVLSVHIYDLAMNVVGGERNASSSAVVLMLFMATLSLAIMGIKHRWKR